MKFTEIPAPYLDHCMVSTRSDELRPEIGTTKSRKRNETNPRQFEWRNAKSPSN